MGSCGEATRWWLQWCLVMSCAAGKRSGLRKDEATDAAPACEVNRPEISGSPVPTVNAKSGWDGTRYQCRRIPAGADERLRAQRRLGLTRRQGSRADSPEQMTARCKSVARTSACPARAMTRVACWRIDAFRSRSWARCVADVGPRSSVSSGEHEPTHRCARLMRPDPRREHSRRGPTLRRRPESQGAGRGGLGPCECCVRSA